MFLQITLAAGGHVLPIGLVDREGVVWTLGTLGVGSVGRGMNSGGDPSNTISAYAFSPSGPLRGRPGSPRASGPSCQPSAGGVRGPDGENVWLWTSDDYSILFI
jgi:hypothetical protein